MTPVGLSEKRYNSWARGFYRWSVGGKRARWRENSRKGSDSTWSGSGDAAASRAGSRSGKEAAASSVETTSLSHEADPHRFRMLHVETLTILRACLLLRDSGRRLECCVHSW